MINIANIVASSLIWKTLFKKVPLNTWLMPEPHIEDIMNLTSDIFETHSNVLLILPQKLLDCKHLHNFKSSVNFVGQLLVLSVQDNVHVRK